MDQHLRASSTALIVVDMQEYFCRSDSALNRFMRMNDPETAASYVARVRDIVIPNIAELLQEFRKQGSLIIFTEFGSERRDGRDLPGWARRFNDISHAAMGEAVFLPFSDAASRVVPECGPSPDDLVVRKTTSGPLAGTNIDYTLRRHGIDDVVVAGVATDFCVLGMARELADANFDIAVVSDAAATPQGDAAHDAILQNLGLSFATIETASGILARLQTTAQGQPAVRVTW